MLSGTLMDVEKRTPDGERVYQRMTMPDDQRTADDPVRQSLIDPCCLEHVSGRICILPSGHP